MKLKFFKKNKLKIDFVFLVFLLLTSTSCERFVGSSISEKDAVTPTNNRQLMMADSLDEFKRGKTLLIKLENENEICGGIMLNESWILADADCVKQIELSHYQVVNSSNDFPIGEVEEMFFNLEDNSIQITKDSKINGIVYLKLKKSFGIENK